MARKDKAVKTLVALAMLFLIGMLAYVSLDVWFLGEDAPESLAMPEAPQSAGCDPSPDYDCAEPMYEEWMPLCATDYNGTTQCYDPDTGEEVCAYADGPYYHDYGAYFDVEWDYCDTLGWSEDDDLDLGFVVVPQEAVGTVTTGALPFAAKFGLNAITGKARMKKAIVEALREQHD